MIHNSGSSRRGCAYLDNELVEFFEEHDEWMRSDNFVADEMAHAPSLDQPSTEAVQEVESSTMLAGLEDDGNDFTWKDILIA